MERDTEYWEQRCEQWSWNKNETEVAAELISKGIIAESEEYRCFESAFEDFFDSDPESTARNLEVIANILDVFGSG
jgi:hypothetical protein